MPEPVRISEAMRRIAELRDELGVEPAILDAAEALELDDAELQRTAALARLHERELAWRGVCPQRFHGSTWEWVEAEHGAPIAAKLRDWSKLVPRPNLVILGPIGTGKTAAALLACHADAVEHRLDVEFLPSVEMLDRLRPGGPEHALADLMDVARLIVDDLGGERATDWTAERLYAVVNRRWMEERPIISTSNLIDRKDLVEAMGERTVSRLTGNDAVIVTLGGEDRRRRKR